MELLASGEIVNELMVLVSGQCAVMNPGALGTGEHLILGEALHQNAQLCVPGRPWTSAVQGLARLSAQFSE